MEGMAWGELGLSPKPWREVPFSETVEILSGGTPSISQVGYWGGPIPWYSVADAPSPGDVFVTQTEKTVTSEGIDNSAAQVVPELTTIISARGTVGRCALTGRGMAFNQSCFGLLPADHIGYYFTYFSTLRIVDELQQSAHGSVFSTITRPSFASVHVPQPPADLVTAFEARVRPLMMRIRSNVDESRTLRTTRDSLLPRLIGGEPSEGVA
jgi:type I restriction enzyme S subunit